ncbi:MAG: drug/metabolite transporter (DMT)-like permease [Paracoccaceae bacterium]|jgi:drug/metabolite transporter (DMT)-like permease
MNPLRGIAFKIISIAAASAMAACVKAVADDIPPGQIVFFRSVFALPPLIVIYALRGELRSGLRVKARGGHVLRGAIGAAGMGLMFTSYGLLPLPEATAITFAAPLFATLLAAPLLGERLRRYRIMATLAGLAGVAVVMAPRLTIFGGAEASTAEGWGAAAALAAALFMALAQIQVRRLTRTETTTSIVLWFTISCSVYSLVTIGGWRAPDPAQWALLALAGLLGGVAQVMLTAAYKNAEAGLVAPFDYLSMLFATLIGFAIFAEIPATPTIIGAAVVIVAGIAVIRRERQLGLGSRRARQASAPRL